MDELRLLSEICSCATAMAAAVVLLVKPARERFTGFRALRDGQKCLLRSSMLRTYYRNRESGAIRQYELENFNLAYRAYKALKGNSFIDRIYAEVQKWQVLS
ncbi:MAG: hypothetical protein E7426_00180 [Ruminococcaceae bacterium]|nr:hypothetical protein [Oscillospiraceae bacterium]